MVENDHSKPHATYSTDIYQPVFLPIFGIYNDYGAIDEIEMDDNVKFIEDYFGKGIEEIVEDVDNMTCRRYEYKKCSSPKNNDLFKKLVFALEHRFVYDEMSKPFKSFLSEGRSSLYFLEDIMRLKMDPNPGPSDRYSKVFKIPGNEEYYIATDSSSSCIFDYKNHKEVDKFEGEYFYTYSPDGLINGVKRLTGIDLLELNNRIKNVDIFDIKYDITKIKIAIIESKKKRSEELGKVMSDCGGYEFASSELKKELMDSMRDDSWIDMGHYKGAQFINLENGREGNTKVMYLLKESGVIMNEEFKPHILNFLRFNDMVNNNSWIYRLSSYSDQSTDFKSLLRINKKYVEFIEHKIKFDEGEIEF
jgi:hypothetical protein